MFSANADAGHLPAAAAIKIPLPQGQSAQSLGLPGASMHAVTNPDVAR